ncbi:hypothetical protein [Sinorhizobium medicae]|uniref:hypothetical protein n=1 Tax=Sinorhizobium medicae TaxID=110321 RepID=UPI0011A8C64B|nr:hypothetical protein [Sinorhizobium medicae]
MELGTCGNHLRRGRLMATITHVFTINHVAEMLGEDRELLEAIVSNSDNLTVSATSIPRLSSVDGGGAVRCFRTSALRALA